MRVVLSYIKGSTLWGIFKVIENNSHLSILGTNLQDILICLVRLDECMYAS